MISYILAVITGVLALGADQFTKWWIPTLYEANTLVLTQDSIPFIPKIVEIHYTENGGAAWGLLDGHPWLLVSIAIVGMLVIIASLLKYGIRDKLMFWASMLILSGGIGNLIDRIQFEYVRDFLHLEFWPTYPVFNVADCTIVIGVGLVIFSLIKSIVDEQRSKSNAHAISEENNNTNENA